MSRTFVIVDGSSLMYRAFYALPLLTTADGQYTNAIYGFTTMLVKLLADIKPDRIAVAFDKGKITFRNDLYTEYKGHRKPTPTELSPQFTLIKEILGAFHIQALEQAGYEADDIIGTLATKASQAEYNVIIVTGDKDALQLIDSRVTVMLTKKGISSLEVVDEKTFQEKYSVSASQLIDIKGLMGDASDNIPGVPGVGEKTAIKLISEFGSVENLLTQIDKVSGKKLQENLRNNVDIALLSKKLATIIRDMTMEFDPEEYKFQPDKAKMYDLFTKFEFKSLLTRLADIVPDDSYSSPKVIVSLPEAEVLTNYEDVLKVVQKVRESGTFEFYPILVGKVPDVKIQGLSVLIADKALYIPAEASGWESILTLLTDSEVAKVTYDAKKICNACETLGITLNGLVFDIMLAAYLLDPTATEYPLPVLSEKYLSQPLEPENKKNQVTPSIACQAIRVIHSLYPVLQEALVAAKLDTLFYELELPLVPVLAALEHTGIQIDNNYRQEMSIDISTQIDALLKEIYLLADEEFNMNSPKQLGSILFDKLKLPVMKKTKTGYSTDVEVLEKLFDLHPIIDLLLKYRVLTKLKSTYLDGLAELINPQTTRVHTTFNQTVTATGRLSSSEPNLQNIPIRTEIGRRIRELFIPGAGYDYIMSVDYSQIELRILAHMSSDPNLLDSFMNNQDVHTRTAAEVFEVPIDEVTPDMRGRAKAVNFGIIYGISDYGLSRDIGVSRKEAGKYITSYFEKYHGVKKFIDEVVKAAHRDGYVTTLLGRRRYLPDINSNNFNQRSFAERTAMNTPIQGTAADIIKKAMLDVHYILTKRNLHSRILLQVHDELVLEVTAEETELVGQLVKQTMEETYKLAVPMIADVKIGKKLGQGEVMGDV